ncbi:GNAT family N-acetyltransferase [Streptomyces rimosus]|uniref:GNAT family N-acetyltransferase n=1 Tax=Streptomyces rimosus TaxID=1927 RepID=UPI00067B6C0B|nr:GNAT family N-acetyltransferase [Streptomyces rimosus]
MTTATDTVVRRAEPEDIDELIRLRAFLLDGDEEQASLPYIATTPEARRAWRAGYRAWLTKNVSHEDVFVSVAAGPDRLRACALSVIDRRPPSPAQPNGRVAWMQTLVTDPRDRGQGLATAVIDRLFEWAAMRGADVATMQSSSGAVEFHRRAGWQLSEEGLYHRPVTTSREA